ncbi:MAG: diguanylate cyclase response regulator [Panacagrimonas sp.]|nr:diguanylate cyclase response regulator [Panacagrimonas sp.]
MSDMILPGRPRLLLVDDQPANIRLLHAVFAEDHDLFMATNGRDALRVCSEQRPDLVLLDLRMPGMNGLEVCRAMKADPALQEIPVIFVTGFSDPSAETEGLEAGAVDFIAKPVNPAVVRARVRTHLTLRGQSRMLQRLAYLDGLTGVTNRRGFDEMLAREWRVALRNESPLGLILMDVDHFKAYNDHYGHLKGDATLQWVAQTLATSLRRPADVLARYGGEEFACLLPHATVAQALQTAEYLRERIQEGAREHVASPVAPVITLSLGATARVPMAIDSDARALLADADALLYRAKQGGRNRVVSAEPGEMAQ